MKLSINHINRVELKEVFDPIRLTTAANETIDICMRDSGFEFSYMGFLYHAKMGSIVQIVKATERNKPNEPVRSDFTQPQDPNPFHVKEVHK